MKKPMTRKEAEKYLKDKGKWENPITKEEADTRNKENTEEVLIKGKIYGDPIANIQWK